jgi:hypothetical protein
MAASTHVRFEKFFITATSNRHNDTLKVQKNLSISNNAVKLESCKCTDNQFNAFDLYLKYFMSLANLFVWTKGFEMKKRWQCH